MRFLASILVGTLSVGSPLSARESPPGSAERTIDSLEEIAAEALAAGGLPGIAVALVDRSGLRAIGVAGVRRRGEDSPIEPGDRFHLGSCTKAVTATLAAILVSEGRIRFESTVGEVLGESIPEMDAGWRDVTLEELLHHRGAAPPSPDGRLWKAAFECTDSPFDCRDAFVRGLLARPPSGERGTFVYSNQGYAIAGRMCERAAGLDWESLVIERIAQPLGMRDVGFGPPSKATAGPAQGGAPSGHAESGEPRDIDNPPAIAPAGTMHCPIGEWARFVAVHLGASDRLPLAGAGGVERLHRPTGTPTGRNDQQIAMGWMSTTRPWGGRVLTHAGSNTLWYCVAWVAPERGFAVLAATNQGGAKASAACDQAVAAIIRRYADSYPAAPAPPTP